MMKKHDILLFLALSLCLFLFCFLPAQYDSADFNKTVGPLKIIRITPAGEDVPAERQIVFKFNMPVVSVGRMERTAQEIPISITPKLKGQWRWLNTSSLALQLSEQESMKPATKYTVRIEPRFVSTNGNRLQEGQTHTFITLRPQIRYVHFRTWQGPGHPVIRLDFNQKVKKQTVLSHIFFQGPNSKTIPAVENMQVESYYGSSVNIEPAKELPLDTEFQVVVTPGIISEAGPEPGKESRVFVVFHTFPEFKFLGFRGYDNNGGEVNQEADGKNEALFSPLRGVFLLFSTPVPARQEGSKLHFEPDLAGGRKDYDPWADAPMNSYYLQRPHHQQDKYEIFLPEVLQAARKYNLSSQADFQDVFGNRLKKPIQASFTTSHRPPELFIKNEISVLEKNEMTHMPIVITNLKQIEAKYRLLDEPQTFQYLPDLVNCHGDFNANQTVTIKTDDAQDIAYAFPFKVRDLLQGRSGAVVGHLLPEPAVNNECTLRFFSQVTNLALNVKLGHHNTLVWVTRMDNGKPVAQAKVELFLSNKTEPADVAKTDNHGLALLKGTIDIDPQIQWLRGYLHENFGLVRVTIGIDSALLPLIWEFMDNSFYYYGGEGNESNRCQYSHLQAWGYTGQGVYKPGDTIQYKIYVRDQSNRKFILPKLSSYDLDIINPAGNKVQQQTSINLSDFGSFQGSYTVPKEALSGWYRFELRVPFGRDLILYPLRVLVTDFTPAPFKVQTDLKGQMFKIGDRVEVESGARLHSGGPYGKAQARITARLLPVRFQPVQSPMNQFDFMDYNYDYNQRQVFQTEEMLSDKGDLTTHFTLQDLPVVCGTLTVESAVRDDRGKYIASSASARFMGRDRLVGLQMEQWLLKQNEAAEFRTMVVDEKGRPAKGTAIEAIIEYDRVTGTRVKGAGNAYLIQYQHSREQVKTFNLKSELKPLSCKFVPMEPGTYFVTARIKDMAGRIHAVSLSKYAAGQGRILWELPEDNSLAIIPAQQEYKVGQRARFMVKNPFPGCRALISIERLGVLKQWTQVFSDNTPVIEFTIEPDHVPGFYLSIVIHSPRVDKPIDENNIDLGKPACRMGYLTVTVNDPYKRLLVKAKTNQETYRPRSKVTLDMEVADIQKKIPQSELAVVVLDEAVLDLIQGGADYFDPYKGFYKLGDLDLRNYDLLFRLVGRQRFEKKGANSGGSGGDVDFKMRDLFKFICYWNPEIRPDAKGHAQVTFDLPDNLTGWRVLALAVTKDDLMGLGQTRFVVNKLTEIQPALPNQVTEGDFFEAVFTVMNRTDRERQLRVEIKAEGEAEAVPIKQMITAKPYARNKVRLPLKALKNGEIRFTVRAGDAEDRDGLVLVLKVHKKQAVETAATYGTTTANQLKEAFEFPENMRNDTGKVSLVVSPAIISSLDGAFSYMRNYPYFCWEQRLSKGVMAMHYLNLKPYLSQKLAWNDAGETVRNMLADARSFQAPNGGMCYFIPLDQYVCPYLSAYTAIAFNWLKQSGYQPEPAVERALHAYLSDFLKRDLAPTFFSKGMSSTVRAVALAALAQNGRIQKSDLERFRPHVEYMDLFGQAHFLLAAVFTDNSREIQAEIYDRIMAHANETGGKVVFTDPIYGQDIRGGFGRILSSEMRTNAAVLSALLAMEEKIAGKGKATQEKSWLAQTVSKVVNYFAPGGRNQEQKMTPDTAFKIVRYLTQTRKNRDHWENTQENTFCLQALTAFSRIYDRETPHYKLTAFMDKKVFGQTSFHDFRDPAVELQRPVVKTDPGRKTQVVLQKEGPGRVYYAARLFYSPEKLKPDPINSGIEVHREYYLEKDNQWLLLQDPMQIKQGDLVRVDLFVSLPSARNFVVVADPVPGGLEAVNRDLATASQVDADKDAGTYAGSSWFFKFGDWQTFAISRWSFYHREVLHHAVRFYSDYLPAGNYHLSYVAQAIVPGRFYIMPLHAEEMYDPDVFGQSVPLELKVGE